MNAVALYLGMSVILAQAPLTLGALTVPPERLPGGCQLEAPSSDPTPAAATARSASVHGDPLTANPLSGTEIALKLEARDAVDGRPSMPYAPTTPRELGSFRARWVENVVEAYRARYESDDSEPVSVWAVRFDDSKRAAPEPPLGTRMARAGATARIVLGAIVVRVSTSTNSECFQAVRKHVESLPAPR